MTNYKEEIMNILIDNFDLRESWPLGCNPLEELVYLLHDFSEELIGKDEKVNPLHGNCEVCTPKRARNQFRAERREKVNKLLGRKK